MKQVVLSVIIATLGTIMLANVKATPMTTTDINFTSLSVSSVSTDVVIPPTNAFFGVNSTSITPPPGAAVTGISPSLPIFSSSPIITGKVVAVPINAIHHNVLKNIAPPTPIIMSIPSIKPLVQIIDTGAKTMARGIDLNTISLKP